MWIDLIETLEAENKATDLRIHAANIGEACHLAAIARKLGDQCHFHIGKSGYGSNDAYLVIKIINSE